MLPCEIMLVEDELITQEYIKFILIKLGARVLGTATSGEAAVEMATRLRPGLILMDIRLEGSMDGIEAARLIREKLDIPIVFLTAYTDELTMQRARITAPFGYITKPFKEKELHTAVQIALHRHEIERALRETEERYQTLLADVPVAVLYTTPDGKLLDVNDAGVGLFGYPSRDDMLREFDAHRHYAISGEREFFKADRGRRDHFRNHPRKIKTLAGEVRQVLESSRTFRDAMGNVKAYQSVLEDVTERFSREGASSGPAPDAPPAE